MKNRIFPYPDSYRTGDTQPPEKKQWLALLILAALIFVSSIFCILSFFFPHFSASPAPKTLAYAKLTDANTTNNNQLYGVDVAKYDILGISGQVVPSFFRMYYDMPAGIYITAVEEETPPLSPFLPGDILISCHGENITTHYQLTRILQSLWDNDLDCWTEDTIIVEVYRKDRIQQLYISLE